MARTVPIDRLKDEIDNILAEYAEGVSADLSAAVKKVGASGAKALRAESKRTFPRGSGRYAKGWTVTTTQSRSGASAVIHNRDLPGLPHLLEFGHANRNGGRTEGRVHIAPIEKEVVEAFEKEVLNAL